MTCEREGGRGFGIPTFEEEDEPKKAAVCPPKTDVEKAAADEGAEGPRVAALCEREGGRGFGLPTFEEVDGEARTAGTSQRSGEAQVSKPKAAPVMDVASAGQRTSGSCEREGGRGFGIPSFDDKEKPEERVLPKVDGKFSYQLKAERRLEQEAEQAFEESFRPDGLWRTVRRVYVGVVLFVSALLGFYTITQTATFLVQLKDLPELVRYPLYVAVGAFATVILVVVGLLLRSLFRLRRSPQVALGMVSTLEGRRRLRQLGQRKADEACEELYGILCSVQEKEYGASLRRMRVSADRIEELSAVRQELCRRQEQRRQGNERESSLEWLELFAERYQVRLDTLAGERIKYYSYRGGIAAAISHVPSMDRFIVLSAMFGLVRELLVIYHVRPSRTNTALLLGKVVSHTFFSGYVQEGAEMYGESIQRALEAFRVSFCELPLVKGVLQASVSRVAEATAQGFLIQHVGLAAQKMLLPVRRAKR